MRIDTLWMLPIVTYSVNLLKILTWRERRNLTIIESAVNFTDDFSESFFFFSYSPLQTERESFKKYQHSSWVYIHFRLFGVIFRLIFQPIIIKSRNFKVVICVYNGMERKFTEYSKSNCKPYFKDVNKYKIHYLNFSWYCAFTWRE